jgi:hypothetical protein
MRLHETSPRWLSPKVVAAGALVALVGCAPATGGRSGRNVTAVGSFDVSSYCELAARPDLAALTGSSAVVCEAMAEGFDEALPSCRVLVADASGAVSATELEGAVAALRAGDGRFVVLTSDERLVLHDGRREIRELASWAAEPSLDAAGSRVAFVAPLEGAERAELGEPTRLVSLEIASGRLTTLSNDETASAPIFVPDGSAVLFVTTASSVASIARVAVAGGEAQVLTNEGLLDMGQGYVPPYDTELAWSGSTLVYAALSRDERSELWALDARTGEASRVGEGTHPMATDDGSIVVRDAADGRCPVSLQLEVTP